MAWRSNYCPDNDELLCCAFSGPMQPCEDVVTQQLGHEGLAFCMEHEVTIHGVRAELNAKNIHAKDALWEQRDWSERLKRHNVVKGADE